MSGFGFSVGDIITCGKICHQLYKACFSEAGDAIASWTYLGRELFALGTALKALSVDDTVIPSHMRISDSDHERFLKEQRALEAVRMVVGDFTETLKELETMLLKYDDFQKTSGAKQYWLKIKFTVNAEDLDKTRAKIAMHTRAINLLLNPLMYQQMKGIQTSVSNIQTRIDTIDQVLHALLFVASEQLTTSTAPRPNSGRISAVEPSNGSWGPQSQRLLEPNYMDTQTVPGLLLEIHSGRPNKAEEMLRSTSHPAEFHNTQSSGLETKPRRSTTDPHEGSSTYNPALSRSERRKHDPPDHEGPATKYKGKQAQSGRSLSISQSPPTNTNHSAPKTKGKAPANSFRLGENPIDELLRKQTESSQAQDIPIEHWITAAMHWYFKAECELDQETGNHEISLEAYLGLMKSTWIVENVIRRWVTEDELPREIKINIETLIVSIVDKFGKMESLKMPNIRNLEKQDFEIWHEDIRQILVKPILPISRAPTIRGPWDRVPNSRRQSASSGYSADMYPATRQGSFAVPDTPIELPHVISGDMYSELDDWASWTNAILMPGSLRSGHRASVPGDQPTCGLPGDLWGSFPKPNVGRSPSVSTSSTGSSGRQESFNIQSLSTTRPVSIPGMRPSYIIPRVPVPLRDPSVSGQSISSPSQPSGQSSLSEVNENEFVEMIGERLVLNKISVLWASRSSGPFTAGEVKIFWHQSDEYFRLFTTWGVGRSNSQDIPLRCMELIPVYAYDEEPVIFLRKVGQWLATPSNVLGTSPSAGTEMSRKGYVYKFNSHEELLKFQSTLTGEDVYQDLIKRVSTVKLRRLTENGGHTYHNARLQLWHEKAPADSLLPDTASGLTGISHATRVKLSLQWSRLIIYLGGSDCFITCFVTDDITLKRDGNKLSLVPTKYSAKDVFKSPKGIKAVLAGGEHAKGGFRLDKDKISPNDEHSFDDFSYIQITFKEILYLNKFETLWNRMMDNRRTSRIKIQALQKEIERNTYAPGYDA